ncbi:MAG: hypothetical protein M3Q56_11195 [Bacteroidota bacterium]|nr:hypothetical protein [Bacteroidota bacterium]
MSIFRNLFQLEEHRKNEIESQAYNVRMKFDQEDKFGLRQQLNEFGLFKKGGQKKVKNILSKEDIIENEYIFDYQYSIQANNNRITYKQTVVFFDSKHLSLPHFQLKPENFMDKILSWIGIEDINFLEYPVFSEKFKLTGEYQTIIREYFQKDVIDLLSTQKSFYMEGMNYYLIMYDKNNLLHPSLLPAFHHLAKMIMALFKLHSKDRTLDL